MYNPTPSTIAGGAGGATILATALTDEIYTTVTRLWAGDATQAALIPAGTLVGEFTSGPDAGKVGEYDPAATDGRQTATGILHSDIFVGELYAEDNAGVKTAVDTPQTIFTSGDFIAANLVNLDPAAEAALGGGTTSAGIFSF